MHEKLASRQRVKNSHLNEVCYKGTVILKYSVWQEKEYTKNFANHLLIQ